MGVIHKLKPEITSYISASISKNPLWGCRMIADNIRKELNTEISKSSISAFLKSAGLSKSVGRRRIHKRRQKPQELLIIAPNSQPAVLEETGLWFLKAAGLTLGDTCPGLINRIKFTSSDGRSFSIDGNFHTIWQAGYAQNFFANSPGKIQGWLNQSLLADNKPIILQAVCGFQEPPEILLTFIECLSGQAGIKTAQFYGPEGQIAQTIEGFAPRENFFIIGLWPWQYEGARSIEYISPPEPFMDSITSETYEIAWVKIVLRWQRIKKEMALDGVVINKKKRFVAAALTNMSKETKSAKELAAEYLCRWPHLELGYQDFLEKIKTYGTKDSTKCPGFLTLSEEKEKKEEEFARIYFFPLDMEWNKYGGFCEFLKRLKAVSFCQNGHFEVKFNVQSDLDIRKALIYACQRVNERDLTLSGGERVYFKVA